MPTTTATINAEQRLGLYELVRNHLGGLDDVWIAMEQNRDFATAQRLGREFAGDMRLLDDLGWHEDDEREAIELTMPADELVVVLKRLRADAANAFVGSPHERRAREEDERAEESYRAALDACDELLTTLASREGDSV